MRETEQSYEKEQTLHDRAGGVFVDGRMEVLAGCRSAGNRLLGLRDRNAARRF